MSKGTEARDFNLIVGNASYVQTWSMIQCAIVIICTIVQVVVEISGGIKIIRIPLFRSNSLSDCSQILGTRRVVGED